MSGKPMTDVEAAERLGFSVRQLRPIIDELGLCLRIRDRGRRRLTEEMFVALQSHLTRKPCPSISSKGRRASTAYGGPITENPLTEALKLAAEAKLIKSARKSNGKSLKEMSSAKPRHTASPKQPETTCAVEETASS